MKSTALIAVIGLALIAAFMYGVLSEMKRMDDRRTQAEQTEQSEAISFEDVA